MAFKFDLLKEIWKFLKCISFRICTNIEVLTKKMTNVFQVIFLSNGDFFCESVCTQIIVE